MQAQIQCSWLGVQSEVVHPTAMPILANQNQARRAAAVREQRERRAHYDYALLFREWSTTSLVRGCG